MSFIIHYIVHGPVRNRHFDYVTDEPITRRNLDTLYAALARDANSKSGPHVYASAGAILPISDEEIVIANIIPIPSGEPKPHPARESASAAIGGS